MKRTIKSEELYTSEPSTPEQMTKTPATNTFETVPSACAPSFPTQIIMLFSYHREESGLLVLWRDPDIVVSSTGSPGSKRHYSFREMLSKSSIFKTLVVLRATALCKEHLSCEQSDTDPGVKNNV